MVRVFDPIRLKDIYWPRVRFYKEQRDIIYSVRNNDITVVSAGNQMGKDFVAAFSVLDFFLTREPCRIVTTSVDEQHLEILWGEIHRFIRSAAVPLDSRQGGPLVVNLRELRRLRTDGTSDPLSYVVGRVAARGEGMLGAHASSVEDTPTLEELLDPSKLVARVDRLSRTMLVIDEASGVPQTYFDMGTTWATTMLIFGNPWPCEWFRWMMDGKPFAGKDEEDKSISGYFRGCDIPRGNGSKGFHLKRFKLPVTRSPNIRLALKELKEGKEPSGVVIVPGVKTYDEYLLHRRIWDKEQQTVSLDAEFYKGEKLFLFPEDWLELSCDYADTLIGQKRTAKAMGLDTAEGVDSTAWCIVDDLGVIELVSEKTSDTSVIVPRTISLMQEYGLCSRQVGLVSETARVAIDRGGGGKQIADEIRKQGYNVRTVAFGEAATTKRRKGVVSQLDREREAETKYTYRLRREEMYGNLSMRLEPMEGPGGIMVSRWGIPRKYVELLRQLSLIPKKYDEEGRLYIPPKNPSPRSRTNNEETLIKLIGRSPDEADATVMANHAMVRELDTYKILV